MKSLFLRLATIMLALCAYVSLARSQSADVPRMLSYQGVIRTSEGAPLTGKRTFSVRLYRDPDGKQLLWQDEFTSEITDGLFNLSLGSNKALPETSKLGAPLWIGVTVGNGEELRPLSPITASAYALNVPNGSITAEKIGTDYVSSIYVNGVRVGNRGESVNFVTGNGLTMSVDPITNAVLLDQKATKSNDKGANLENQPVTDVTASSPLASSGGVTPNISLSGVVAISHGGTGSSTQNFVDLSTAQTVGGLKTFSAGATMSAAVNMSSNQIHNVATPTSSSDASTKGYADNIYSALHDSLTTETSRATAAENTIAGNLNTESTTRASADNALTTSLSNETTRATAAENTLTSNLNAEISNRQSAVSSEVTARTSADNTLTTNLNTEIARAESAESTIANNLTTEISNRQSAITSESNARSSADATLTSNLNSEIANRQSGDASEASTRSTADSITRDNLATEVSRAEGAEGVLTTNLNSEITARQTSVNSEASARSSSDSVIRASLNSEISRAQGAESTLTTNLNAEIAARTAADAQDIATTASPTFAGMTLNGDATTHSLIPATNNTFDLGNSSHRWAHLYGMAGTFGGAVSIAGQLSLSNGLDMGGTDLTNGGTLNSQSLTTNDATINSSLSTNGPIYNYNSLFELQPMYLYSTLYNYSTTSLGGTLDMNFNSIVDLSDPTNAQDAANKNYVDIASTNVTADFSGFASGTYTGHTLSVTGSTANVVNLVGYNASVSGSDDEDIGIQATGQASGGGTAIGGNFVAKNTSSSGYAIAGRFSATGASHNIAVQATNGSIQVQTAGEGIILKSPNGTCYKLTVNNDGTLSTTALSSCP